MAAPVVEGIMTRNAPSAASLASVYGPGEAAGAALRFGTLARRLPPAPGGTAPPGGIRFYSAPGRTELGGNHTDHNRGRVLCAAVGLDAACALAPRNDGIVRMESEGYPRAVEVDLRDLDPRPEEAGTTAALVRGVARGIADRAGTTGAALRGCELRVHSLVLQGSGLSSSAAVEVLLCTALADLAGLRIPPVEAARIGQFAENVYFRKPCGLMDQTASAVGGICAIDFADPGNPLVDRLDFDFAGAGYALVVVDTGGSHADLTPEYAAIPAEMRAVAGALGAGYLREVDPARLAAAGPAVRAAAGDRAFLRALHFFRENDRVPAMAAALRRGDTASYLALVTASGDSSWRLLQNLHAAQDPRKQGLCVALALGETLTTGPGSAPGPGTGPEIPGESPGNAREPAPAGEGFAGRIVARVHGGGFAGTVQAYVPLPLLHEYRELMESHFGPGCVIPLRVRAAGATRLE